MGSNTRPSQYATPKSYGLRTNGSNRGNFKHLSSHTTSVSGGNYASMNHEMQNTSTNIQVQQEVSVMNDDDTRPLRSSR